uniref:Uncharacterized protein n=1 Tax=Equus asinus asinus TaxID=83772 RepID=A0A8C4L9Q2_EQUAS
HTDRWNRIENGYMWFEGVPFPTAGFTPEVLREARESFAFKDEDVLLLTYPKSGKEAGHYWGLEKSLHGGPS